jgi:hypothetical protein
MFADAIRLADDWFLDGGDRDCLQQERTACDMVDGNTDRITTVRTLPNGFL